MKLKRKGDLFVFNIIGFAFMTVFVVVCIIPFIMIISGSFTSSSYITRHGYGIFPAEISTAAYKLFFKTPDILLHGYKVTTFVTLTGTLAGLFLTSMTSYVLYRKDFVIRNKLAFFLYFTTLFSGGIVPWYMINIKYLHLKNSYLALILPPMLNVFYILILRNFMTESIPDSLFESAKIDGADDFQIFIKIILPLIKPALACIGLFMGVNYWNDWFLSMLYISKEHMFSLQYQLYRILNMAQALRNMMTSSFSAAEQSQLPTETTKLAMTVIATGPIIFAYPFVQKYFVKGLIIGAVKG